MSEYFDWLCVDDLDPFGRDATPLEVLAQDVFHLLITSKMSLLRDPDWGFDLESYLGKPLPSTLAYDVEAAIRRDDRVSGARCTITKIDGQDDAYRFDVRVEVDETFLDLALALTPSGVVRLA